LMCETNSLPCGKPQFGSLDAFIRDNHASKATSEIDVGSERSAGVPACIRCGVSPGGAS
jgi:hypothetical protein